MISLHMKVCVPNTSMRIIIHVFTITTSQFTIHNSHSLLLIKPTTLLLLLLLLKRPDLHLDLYPYPVYLILEFDFYKRFKTIIKIEIF